MQRPKHNIKTGLYDLTEAGVTISIPFNLLTSWKKYYAQRGFSNETASTVNRDWYKQLSQADKRTVVVTGQAEGERDWWGDG